MEGRKEAMNQNHFHHSRFLRCAATVTLLAALAGCSQTEAPKAAYKKLPAGEEFSGFLGDYSGLKLKPEMEGETLTYVNPDKMKNLRRYVAIMIDPVEVYVSTDADESQISEKAPEALAKYFQYALGDAVGDVFQVVEEPGPLVLRLRAAIVGIDAGGKVAASDVPAETGEALERSVSIGEVGVEMELVDSETGERIAAAVDRTPLGEGAEVGATHFSRLERFRLAKEAFDGWAERLREFMDSSVELTGQDAELADTTYQPYEHR
jgi:hypothetical protein